MIDHKKNTASIKNTLYELFLLNRMRTGQSKSFSKRARNTQLGVSQVDINCLRNFIDGRRESEVSVEFP